MKNKKSVKKIEYSAPHLKEPCPECEKRNEAINQMFDNSYNIDFVGTWKDQNGDIHVVHQIDVETAAKYPFVEYIEGGIRLWDANGGSADGLVLMERKRGQETKGWAG